MENKTIRLRKKTIVILANDSSLNVVGANNELLSIYTCGACLDGYGTFLNCTKSACSQDYSSDIYTKSYCYFVSQNSYNIFVR